MAATMSGEEAKAPGSYAGAEPATNGERLRGTCARWNPDRGFGFITPEGGGADLFCHFSALQEGGQLLQGAAVTYEIGFDDRSGKERALSVTGGSPGGRGIPTPNDSGGLKGTGKFKGVVARWNTDRGFGFITPVEGGEDLFCHMSAITDGNALFKDFNVTFDKEVDEKRGKTSCVNVAGGVTEVRRPRDGVSPRGMPGQGGAPGYGGPRGGFNDGYNYNGGNYNQGGYNGGYNNGGPAPGGGSYQNGGYGPQSGGYNSGGGYGQGPAGGSAGYQQPPQQGGYQQGAAQGGYQQGPPQGGYHQGQQPQQGGYQQQQNYNRY